MKVAVVGGGLFGCTAAVYAARAGHEVHLFEAKPKLMQGATSACYYRLHRGYHYPRSDATGLESLAAEASFREEYGESVIEGGAQFYAIPDGAKVSGPEFVRFMNRMGLPHRQCSHRLIEAPWVFSVAEPRIDPFMLAVLAMRRVREAGVAVHLNTAVEDALPLFDRVVVAAYAGLNGVMRAMRLPPEEYKFQVVEKPIVRLSTEFANTSILVMDECCIDPHQFTDYHALGHVSDTIHAENVGFEAKVPTHVRSLIESGTIRHHSGFACSHVRETLMSIAEYVPAVRGAVYMGSQYAVRAVLPHQEETDARPTLVRQLNDRVIQIFSGKLGTAVTAARQAVDMMDECRVAA